LLICASIESVSAAARDMKINAYTPVSGDQEITDYAAFELIKDGTGKEMAMHVFADAQKLKELCRGIRDRIVDPRPMKRTLNKRLRGHRKDVDDFVDSQDNIQSELGDAIEELQEYIDSKLKEMKKKVKAAKKALGASSNNDFDPWARKDECMLGKGGARKKKKGNENSGKRNARKKKKVRYIQTQTSFSSESEEDSVEEEDFDPLEALLEDADGVMSGKKRKTRKKTSHVLLKTLRKKDKKKDKQTQTRNKNGKKK